MSVPEYVDVYGIPFEVIPIKKKPQNPPPSAKEVKLVVSGSNLLSNQF